MSVLHQDSGGIGKSIPSALEISLGHGFCTPRPSGFPSGFALGKSLGSRGAKPMAAGNLSRFPSTLEISLGLRPREISRVSANLSGVGDGFPNTSLVLVKHGYNVPDGSVSQINGKMNTRLLGKVYVVIQSRKKLQKSLVLFSPSVANFRTHRTTRDTIYAE